MLPHTQPSYTAIQVPKYKDTVICDLELESTIKMVTNLKSSAARLSNFQTLCLLLIPAMTMCLGGVLIYLAVQCDWSGGLRIDQADGIVCLRITTDAKEAGEEENEKGMSSTAVVLKICVLVLIVITIGATITICAWFSMKKWQEKHQRLIAEYAEKFPQLYPLIYTEKDVKHSPIYRPSASVVAQVQPVGTLVENAPESEPTTQQAEEEPGSAEEVKIALFNPKQT